MATIRFYTRTKEQKLATVFIRFTDTRETDIRIPTPYRIFPRYWNEKKQALNRDRIFSEEFTEEQAQSIEDKFKDLKNEILKEHFKLTAPASKEWLTSTINNFYYKEAPSNENLTQYIKRFVEEATSGERLATAGSSKKRYAYGTTRMLRGCMKSFEMFCKDKKKNYNFNDITIDFYNDFIKFFYARNCGANYIGKLISTLKTIMRQAREDGLHNNMEIERKAFKTLKEPVDSIYLTEAELKSMYKLDLSDNKPAEIMRDVFLTGCYTAQRYSDYSKLNKDNIKIIDGNRVIVLTQKKTGEKCLIPIRPEL